VATVYRRLTWGGSALKWGANYLAWRSDEVADEQFNPGAGGGWAWKGASTEEDQLEAWKRRRKKLKELEDIIKRAAGEIPDDAPEKQVVEAAADKVEQAAEVQQHPIIKTAPPPSIAPLLAAAQRAEQALLAYKARKISFFVRNKAAALERYKSQRLAELIAEAEEDDEDVLLLLS
jgi:hypothetical protein